MNLIQFFQMTWTALPTIVSVIVIFFIICAFAEHWVHSSVLHGAKHENDPAYAGHVDHHKDHDHRRYKHIVPGETFGLGFWMFLKVNAVLSFIAAVGAYSLGDQCVFWTGMLTAGFYFTALEAIHRRIHAPKENGWFESTALYSFLDRCHQVHHARGDLNFSIVAPYLADRVMRTLHLTMVSKSAVEAEV